MKSFGVAAQSSGRSCNGCTFCCRAIAVEWLSKPAWVACQHAEDGVGCRVHATKPLECTTWACAYLQSAIVPDYWYPRACGMVLYFDEGAKRLEVRVPPEAPDAWRADPYHADLRAWAASGLDVERAEDVERVFVRVQGRTFLVLPDRDVDLGIMAEGEQVLLIGPLTADRADPGRWKVYKMKDGTPVEPGA